MTRRLWWMMAFSPLGLAASTITANAAQDDDIDTIVVRGEALRGQTLTDVEPELVLTEEDIVGYGASSIAELLAILAAETSSGRGRANEPPVVLLNGRRVAGFREIGRYPAEAVARVEVFPEEVALQYGFSANQRVINFILKPDTTIVAVEGGTGAPERGGSTFAESSIQALSVDGNIRRSVDGEYRDDPAILESERSLASSDGDTRTLTPDSDEWSAGFSYGRGLTKDAIATLSGSYSEADERSLLGRLDGTADGPIRQQTAQDRDAYLGLSAASGLGRRTWTVTASADWSERDVLTNSAGGTLGTMTPASRDEVTTTTIEADAVLNDRTIRLAGESLAGTLQVGAKWEELEQTEQDGTIERTFDLSRTTTTGRLSVDVPMGWASLVPGDLSLNVNTQVDELSDQGTLITAGTGLTWKLLERFQLIASYTGEEGAPGLSDLQAPAITTPGVRVFDGTSGADTFATVVDGGNPDLVADDRDVYKIGLQIKPWLDKQNRLNIDYTTSSINNESRSFSLLTPEFEAAFPDRVLRDANGDLLVFDRRPVQVLETNRDELRTALNLSWRIKARVVPGGLSREARRRRGGRPGSVRAVVVHRWTLQDEVRAPNDITFDFLDGSASSQLGGTSAHSVDAILYRWNEGFGLFSSLSWQSGTDVDSASGNIAYSDLFLADARITYEFNYLSDRWIKMFPFLKEMRLTAAVENAFDERLDVRDETGLVPQNLDADILDPQGRSYRIELRKRF